MRKITLFVALALCVVTLAPGASAATAKGKAPRWRTLPAAPAGSPSGTYSAQALRNTNDPGGDVPFCQGDIVSASASTDSAPNASVSVSTACSSNPNTDSNWIDGASIIVWELDTTDDGVGDYQVQFENPGDGVEVSVVARSGPVACQGTPVIGPGTSLGATFPASCIGSPATLGFRSFMEWDEAPTADQCDCPDDFAPDDGHFVGYVAKQGYWLLGQDGGVFSFGKAAFHGSTGSLHLNQPVVGMAAQADGSGYWFVAADGGIFAFDAPFFGSMGGQPLNRPIVGMARTPDGQGYWLVASDGGIFSFGTARFFGSMGGQPLNKPIVGMAATPDGRGYWLVASDGGIFAFGTARFFGSTGNVPLNKPIVGMAATPDGRGYWLLASDGGIFSFGQAPFLGSMGGRLDEAVLGMAATASAGGYRMATVSGRVYPFGDAEADGDLSSVKHLNAPIVGMATAG